MTTFDRESDKFEQRLTDAIELVNHETRGQILLTLAACQRDSPREPAMRFSDLRREVGHPDPGNFNYHLQRLTGGLVRKTEAGYRLAAVGQRFLGTLVSGRFDPEITLDLPDETTKCLACDKPASIVYTEGQLRVECPDGHEMRVDIGPRIIADQSVGEALDIGLRRGHHGLRLAVDGVCATCDGATQGGLQSTGDDEVPIVYIATCRRCGTIVQFTVGGCVLDHPAVISFCWDHGLDIRRDVTRILGDHIGMGKVIDDDPLRAAVTVSIDDEQLTVRIDENGEVTSVLENNSS